MTDKRLTVYNEEQAARKLKLPVSAYLAMCNSGEIPAFKDATTGKYMITRDNLKYFCELWNEPQQEESDESEKEIEYDSKDGFFGAVEVDNDETVDFFANNKLQSVEIPESRPDARSHHYRGGRYSNEELKKKKELVDKIRKLHKETKEEEGEDTTIEIDDYISELRDNDSDRILTNDEEYHPVENNLPATVDTELEKIYDKLSDNLLSKLNPKLKQMVSNNQNQETVAIDEITSNSPDPDQMYQVMEFLSKTSSKVVVTQIAFYK